MQDDGEGDNVSASLLRQSPGTDTTGAAPRATHSLQSRRYFTRLKGVGSRLRREIHRSDSGFEIEEIVSLPSSNSEEGKGEERGGSVVSDSSNEDEEDSASEDGETLKTETTVTRLRQLGIVDYRESPEVEYTGEEEIQEPIPPATSPPERATEYPALRKLQTSYVQLALATGNTVSHTKTRREKMAAAAASGAEQRRSQSTARSMIENGRATGRKTRSVAPIETNDSPEGAILQRYLVEMKKDHVYIAKGILAAAQADLNQQKPFRGNGQGGRLGILYDEESPFKNIKRDEVVIVSKETEALRVEGVRFDVVNYVKANTTAQRKHIIRKPRLIKWPKDLPQPRKCRWYTTLRNNVIAENEEEMRYLPYFGEDTDDMSDMQLEQLYVDKTKDVAYKGKDLEYAVMFGVFIHDFLREVDVSEDAVTRYLIGDISKIHGGVDNVTAQKMREGALSSDFELGSIKKTNMLNKTAEVSVAELERAEYICTLFKSVTKVSLWEVIKKTSSAVKDNLSPTKHTATSTSAVNNEEKHREIARLTGGNPLPYTLDTYTNLYCLICHMYECPFHVDMNRRHNPEGSSGMAKGDLQLPTSIPGWSYRSKEAAKDAFTPGEYCSEFCFTKAGTTGVVQTTKWSEAQIMLLRASGGVLRNNPRCACLCTAIINKTCAEIYIRLQLEGFVPESGNPSLDSATPEPVRGIKRKKAPNSILPGYPVDVEKTGMHDKRQDIRPCRHEGSCNSSCDCVRAHVTCEKSCACPSGCPRKWRGCSCRREGKPCSTDSKCLCLKANRECDPDLCGTCGAAELLDPTNRYSDKFSNGYCKNVAIQRDETKKTMLGLSSVSGMGLYICENAKKGDYLGEYKGELITEDEADRRGKLYDKRGISFLFNLNRDQVIDATRMGNKFRYINHSKLRPNCHAKVRVANCVQRIAFWALRELVAGEELFFDYGYNQKCVKFVQMEPPALTNTVIRSAPQAAAPAAPEVTRSNETGDSRKAGSGSSQQRKALEYLKGGAATIKIQRAEKIKTETAVAVHESSGKVVDGEESSDEGVVVKRRRVAGVQGGVAKRGRGEFRGNRVVGFVTAQGPSRWRG